MAELGVTEIICESLVRTDEKHYPAGVGPVAQWLEPAAHNRLVGGSSPSGPTKTFGSCRNKFRAVQNQIRAVQKQPSAVRCSNCISVKILICKVILVSVAVKAACLAAVESCF